jgi:CDP-glucose 4,6-dehydratase
VVGVATARAGNVIGGGDWAEDRLLPDCIKALRANEAIAIRNPHAIRPWQHVLEPLCGYLLLAERLHANAARFGEAWNFGPADEDARPVAWLASRIVQQWANGATWFDASSDAPHESTCLKIDASCARTRLGWAPRLRLANALAWTVDWHQRLATGEPALTLTDQQIARYRALEPNRS